MAVTPEQAPLADRSGHGSLFRPICNFLFTNDAVPFDAHDLPTASYVEGVTFVFL